MATEYIRALSAFTGLSSGRTKPHETALSNEIQASDITVALDHIDYASASEDCSVWFKAALTTAEETILDAVVAAHTGDPPSSGNTDTDGNPIVTLSHARFDSDGKQVIVPSPATTGWNTWFCGAGDDCSETPAEGTGRGTGTAFRLSFTGPGEEYFDAQFREPIEMHDGEIFYSGTWTMDDTFDLSAYIPVTVPTSTPGTGNCNAVDLGGYSMFVPAPSGDGDYTIDTEDPAAYALIPSGDARFWSYSKATGLIEPAPAGDGGCNLLNVAQEVYFMRNVPMGHILGRFEIDTYKVEWMAPGWRLRLRCVKTSSGAGDLGAWIMVFRRFNT